MTAMVDALQDPQNDIPDRGGRTRQMLLRRLVDVACLPGSRINAFERAVTGDLMVKLLREAPQDERRRVSERLSQLGEIPNILVRLLLRDEPQVAEPLILESSGLSDADLVGCARDASSGHREMLAARRGLSEIVTETLISFGETEVMQLILRNATARLSQVALEAAVAQSRKDNQLVSLLLRRPELRPSSAYVMYWWANSEQRMAILQRFAVSRSVLQESVEDVFHMAEQGQWSDPAVRKALQFIERRQRNRKAIEKSPYSSLEEAIEAAETGIDRNILAEISYLSGIKPLTGAKIMSDIGGEPLAILCKATGLSRQHLHKLWLGLKRPETLDNGELYPTWEQAQICYEMLAVDRAQTVLRYWNWALSSAMTPSLVRAIRETEESLIDEYSVPEKSAMLALAENFDH